jgi:hypothetical protein
VLELEVEHFNVKLKRASLIVTDTVLNNNNSNNKQRAAKLYK